MVFNYDIFQTLGVIKLYRVQEKGWSQLFSSGAWCPLKKVACSQNVVTSNPSALKALFSLALLSTWPPCDGGVLGWAKKTSLFWKSCLFTLSTASWGRIFVMSQSFPHCLPGCRSGRRKAYRFKLSAIISNFAFLLIVYIYITLQNLNAGL